MRPRDLYPEAIDAADDLLRDVYRLDVAKALDPLEPRDFLVIVQRLGRSLAGVARAAEAGALRRALAELDVDWPNMTARAFEHILRAAQQALRSAPAHVLPHVDQIFEVEADRMVSGARRSAIRRFGLRIHGDLSRTDERIARFVRQSEGNFIRDAYGRRHDEFSRRAREIVASGHERGLGRNDIVGELTQQLTAVTNRSNAYWETVATSFANRGRTYTQLAAFAEAGVMRFRFEAILDQVTGEACRFMHGRVFSVARAMQRFDEVEAAGEPEQITELQPWVQVGADPDGNQILFYKRGGRRRRVAQVDEASVGQLDKVGRYSRALAGAELEAAGVTTPPLHGRCRSTITVDE